MPLLDTLLGRPLASHEDQAERIGPSAGVPTFGLDALSSAAYGPEAALTVLLPLGVAGLAYVVPITAAILVLLAMVSLSYYQLIGAYPSGGGSYAVARENLGPRAGLVAAAALMTDYVLNVAVGISAGVGALVSAVPSLAEHTLALCLTILALLALMNLRGARETGTAFMLPTYAFVVALVAAIAWGAFRTIAAGGHPTPVVPLPPEPSRAAQAMGAWILLRAFSSGCTALTGVEAVSNGVQAFREPVVNNARRTLSILIVTLAVLLAGIAWLAHAYGIIATEPASPGYQSLLSLLISAIAGRSWFYYATMIAVLMVLCLSANTSFAGFPRLCSIVAADRYLPHSLSNRGRRLVYTEGIVVLTAVSALLLVVFRGVTDRLIPLFAVGAFLAFTFAQTGMVVHWRKQGGHTSALIINLVGALATAVTIVVVLLAKFAEGAWIVCLLIPAMLVVMAAVHAHYDRVERLTSSPRLLDTLGLRPPVVVVPVERWSRITHKALRLALSMSPDVHAVHVQTSDGPTFSRQEWEHCVCGPAAEAGLPPPSLAVVESPYRFIIAPVLAHILQVERDHPGRTVAVVVPELMERRWYQYFLHNKRARLLSTMLLLRGDRRIVIVNVPWHLR